MGGERESTIMFMDMLNVVGTPESDHYMKKTELAKRLRRTPRTLEHWMKLGILPYFKIGRSVLFRWPDVERHLQQRYGVTDRPQRVDNRRGHQARRSRTPQSQSANSTQPQAR